MEEQLSNVRISADDEGSDEQRDWASLPLDLLRASLSAPLLADDRAAKRSAFSTCKSFARAVARTSTSCMLRLEVDRRVRSSSCVPAVRFWRELWGGEQPQQKEQLVVLVLSSSINRGSSPGRLLAKLLGAGERLPFVTQLWLKVIMIARALVTRQQEVH